MDYALNDLPVLPLDVIGLIGHYDFKLYNAIRSTCKGLANAYDNEKVINQQIVKTVYKYSNNKKDNIAYTVNNAFHNVDDQPALVLYCPIPWYSNNSEPTEFKYYRYGVLHRLTGPAWYRLGMDPFQRYYVNGLKHREDGPAVIRDDELHTEKYYMCGKLHREDGPAVSITRRNIEDDGLNADNFAFAYRPVDQEHLIGLQIYYYNGMKHRIGGPAVIYGANDKHNEHWVAGLFVRFE